MSRRQQTDKGFSVLPEGPAQSAELKSADWKDGKFEFPLSRPVEAFGEKRSKLVFREPEGLDIMKYGNPVKFDPAATPPTLEFNDARMGEMLAALAEVPTTTIHKMAPKDFVAACWVVAPFFMPV